ncbi:MAG: hypothetical protein JOZ49_08590 [Mycolicibacterium sp.]|nr:hypothetical protein [Mycolicibacterium sp.]
MDKGEPASGGDNLGDAIGTVGLFLMVTTVIAFAVAVAGVNGAPGGSAVVAALIGALSFAGSLACFVLGSKRLTEDGRPVIREQPLACPPEG